MNIIRFVIVTVVALLSFDVSAQSYVVDTKHGDSLDIKELIVKNGTETVGRNLFRIAAGDTITVLRPIENLSGCAVVEIAGLEYAVRTNRLRSVDDNKSAGSENFGFTPDDSYYSILTPYLYVVCMVLGALVLSLLGGHFPLIRKIALFAVPVLIVASCYIEVCAWLALKTGMFWWCSKDTYGFWGSLLRVLPFSGVLLSQLATYPLYKRLIFQTAADGADTTSIVPMGIAFIAVIPVLFIVLLVCALFHMSKPMQSYVGLGLTVAIIGVGTLITAVTNIKALGFFRGFLFTIFEMVYIVGAMVAVTGLAIAVWKLFIQMLITMLPYLFLWLVVTHAPDKVPDGAGDANKKKKDSTLDIIMGTTEADRKRAEEIRAKPWLKDKPWMKN